jgi:hypothetical protein
VYYEDAETFKKTVIENGKEVEKIFKNVEFFAWEKLDAVGLIKESFGI